MLQRSAVEPGTLAVLDECMQLPWLEDFVLVGGTALALHIGHRISYDIDLFSQKKFDTAEILAHCNSLKEFELLHQTGLGIHCKIKSVKTDIIYFPFNYIKPVKTIDNIRIASIEDIAAMKIGAIYKRGSKRDFYDVFFLLKHLKFAEIIDLFSKKFPTYDTFGLARSLTYFEDAETQSDPILLRDKVTWNEVKTTIVNSVKSIV